MEHTDAEPLTYKRIRWRINMLIEATDYDLPTDSLTKNLLKNVHDDLRQIKAALDYLMVGKE